VAASQITPVALFTYARPHHLRQTLDALRADGVPLIHAFSDGPKTPEVAPAVEEVRAMLRAIDWCDVRLIERDKNLGLGLSIRTGMQEVFSQHDSAIVCEDDLICVKGTYAYLTAALDHYRHDERVMSVTGWNHPRVTPPGVTVDPYFDGRSECLMWGAWARSWRGMDRDALSLIEDCRAKGIDVFKWGADLVDMAQGERTRNIWAVRFFYLHILRGGLCLRPPHSMVEHIGYDAQATNAQGDGGWSNPPLKPSPAPPARWPEPRVNPHCAKLWQVALGARPTLVRRGLRRVRVLADRLGIPTDRLRGRLRSALKGS
jgi:hypothetical protein